MVWGKPCHQHAATSTQLQGNPPPSWQTRTCAAESGVPCAVCGELLRWKPVPHLGHGMGSTPGLPASLLLVTGAAPAGERNSSRQGTSPDSPTFPLAGM